MEYADVIWDGACQKDIDKMNKIHLTAARIVTGGTEKCRTENLLEEVEWESLLSRRRRHKLELFYKIVNGMSPP